MFKPIKLSLKMINIIIWINQNLIKLFSTVTVIKNFKFPASTQKSKIILKIIQKFII